MQETDSHADSSFQLLLKRRLACERCRNQKLKCIRRKGNDHEPCSRCLQAHAECIINPRKAPGRPAGRSHSPGHHKFFSLGNQNQNRNQNQNQETRSHRVEDSIDEALDSSELAPCHGSIISDDLLDIPSDLSLDDPIQTFSTDSPALYTQDLADRLFNYPDITTDLPSLTWSSPGSNSGTVMGHRQSLQMIPDQTSDPGLKLSRLQQKSSQQLLLLKSLSWDITAVMTLDSAPPRTSQEKPPCENMGDFHPLAGTFEIIAEFERLLNTVRGVIAHWESRGSLGLQQEKKVYLLTALSCYLQLVCIYDHIFSYVLDQASSNAVVRNFILHSTPRIALGGFVVPSPKNIWGCLFVQLMQSKLRPIEHALGLPEGSRVTSGLNGDLAFGNAGLIAGKQGELLLAVLQESRAEEANDGRASGAIGALKDKMTRIESLG